jgi:ring-1,2-phenylacetyl-CoA epoxidase subunit PaaE
MCGPEGMMENAIKALEKMDVPNEHIFKESFVAGNTSPSEVVGEEPAEDNAGEEGEFKDPKMAEISKNKTREVTIHFEGETFNFTVPPDSTILETALALDIDLPFSCQSGMCTSCMGKLIEGKVEMEEEDALTEEEIQEGFVLTCVGHPMTEKVEIEIE